MQSSITSFFVFFKTYMFRFQRGCVIIPDYVQPLFCVYTAINLIMPSFFQTYPGISPVYACNK